jgi:excisionase family DNA binding protein
VRQPIPTTDLIGNDVLRAAARVGISRAKLYQEMAAKRLAYFKVGKRRLISEEALLQYIADRQHETTQASS